MSNNTIEKVIMLSISVATYREMMIKLYPQCSNQLVYFVLYYNNIFSLLHYLRDEVIR